MDDNRRIGAADMIGQIARTQNIPPWNFVPIRFSFAGRPSFPTGFLVTLVNHDVFYLH